MDKYAQPMRFIQDHQLHVYMYAFMNFDTKTMPVEDHFLLQKKIVVNCKKMSTPVTVPKHWLQFSYIPSKYY